MIQTINNVPSVSGVNPNSRFSLSLPVGVRSYERIGFEIDGTTFVKSEISNIDLLVNGKPIQSYLSVAHLEILNRYYGYDVNPKEFLLNFYADHLDKVSDRDVFSIGVADVATLQVRGQIGVAVDPQMDAFAVESIDPVASNNKLGLFRKIRNYTYSLVGAGTTEIDNIPREAFAMAMHLIQANGNITNVEAWVDNVRVWDASDSRMQNIVERAGRTREPNVYHLDWMLKNVIGTQLTLSGTHDFRLKIAHSGDDIVNLYVDYLSDFSAG